MTQIDRRQLFCAGTAAAITVLIGSPVARADAGLRTRTISRTAMAVPKASEPLDFDMFYDLSRYVTTRVDLDRAVARDHHALFRNEKWSWANAQRLYEMIRTELKSGLGSAPELMAGGTLSKTDQWFAEHILATWYEGTYRYEDTTKRVTLEGALMWDVMRGTLPVQGLSDNAYGYWSRPPTGAE